MSSAVPSSRLVSKCRCLLGQGAHAGCEWPSAQECTRAECPESVGEWGRPGRFDRCQALPDLLLSPPPAVWAARMLKKLQCSAGQLITHPASTLPCTGEECFRDEPRPCAAHEAGRSQEGDHHASAFCNQHRHLLQFSQPAVSRAPQKCGCQALACLLCKANVGREGLESKVLCVSRYPVSCIETCLPVTCLFPQLQFWADTEFSE